MIVNGIKINKCQFSKLTNFIKLTIQNYYFQKLSISKKSKNGNFPKKEILEKLNHHRILPISVSTLDSLMLSG